MGARVAFHCDHEGCDVAFTMDSAHEHAPGCGADGCGAEVNVPIDLDPVVRFLTDEPVRGGKGWSFAINRLPVPPHARPGVSGLLIVDKCFCPKHADDIKTIPQYKPDAVARQHARRSS